MNNRKIAKTNNFEVKLIMAVKEYGLFSKANFAANQHEWNQAWNALAKKMNVSVSRCRSRWKSLRATFRKQIMRKGTANSKHSVWPYREHMLFMIDSFRNSRSSIKPAASLEVVSEDSIQCITDEDEMEESQELPESEPEAVEEPHEMPQRRELFHLSRAASAHQELPTPIERAMSVDSITKEEPQILRIDKDCYTQETTTTSTEVKIAHTAQSSSGLYGTPSATNEGTEQEEYEGRPVSWRTIDTDEQFLLSCLTTMKRLSRRRNALVRLQIQQLMYDAEFADEHEGTTVS
ncbi:uncharacterized protein LOC126566027 [Anopheles maculipalpis]|uniref:uncharacterized protein LOC126566027 n=1 Tax=Anopheles maculipalpis TaxID=1496333 RepID=UPI0021597976|nr:uncharacterized protein LOC126566027 [Anopheles maculipalpis]